MRSTRTIVAASLLLAGLLAGALWPPCAGGQEQATSEAQTISLPREAVRLAATLPIQEGGRVKPLDTFAGFKLLKLNGRRKVYPPQGGSLGPTEWLLHCLLFPERANTYEVFLVQNDEVLRRVDGQEA